MADSEVTRGPWLLPFVTISVPYKNRMYESRNDSRLSVQFGERSVWSKLKDILALLSSQPVNILLSSRLSDFHLSGTPWRHFLWRCTSISNLEEQMLFFLSFFLSFSETRSSSAITSSQELTSDFIAIWYLRLFLENLRLTNGSAQLPNETFSIDNLSCLKIILNLSLW